MTDTNWCTFCDCAINPCSNLIYCSEECFRRDALTQQQPSLFVTLKEEQPKTVKVNTFTPAQQSLIFDPFIMPNSQYNPSRRESTSSVSSGDLAAMYFDMIPSTPPLENMNELQKFTPVSTPSTPPMSAASASTTSTHSTLVETSMAFSYNLPVHEKLSPIILTANSNYMAQPTLL